MQLQVIQKKIYEVRGQKVMLDFDLSQLYEVENRALKQAVKRNIDRFPDDFMFQLTKNEWQELITNCDNLPDTVKFSPSNPFAFTEQGVAMLSSVLKSKKALNINISIMRAFVMIRQYYMNYKELKQHIEKLENEMNRKFKDVYEALNYMINPPQPKKKAIGYKIGKSDE